jgi:hypothetical protein
MNSIDWLKSVRENDQKTLIPPVPPEGASEENAVNTLIPPVAPCSSVYLNQNENILPEAGQKEIYWGDETVETSGGHRGNSTNHEVNDGSDVRGIRGNQGNNDVSAIAPPPAKPLKPFFTPGGDLSIPFDSDPKYHWWKPGGQSVEKTRAEVLAWMAAERAGQNG